MDEAENQSVLGPISSYLRLAPFPHCCRGQDSPIEKSPDAFIHQHYCLWRVRGIPFCECLDSMVKIPLAASPWLAPELGGPAREGGLTRTVSTEVPTVTFSYKLMLYSGWLKMGRLSFSLMRVIFTLA